jgi:putative mRNA 3-end processing factor
MSLLELTESGLYCSVGNFFIDPWQPVDRAVITHAHSDHARGGSKKYLASVPSEHLLKTRLGADIQLQTLSYGEEIDLNGLTLSLHPAGHILGSSQIRMEYKGEVWVVTGDFKIEPDSTCTPFEQLKCHTLVTESTFGLPVFKWPRQYEIFEEINRWWQNNRDQGKTSILFAYALGKAQRINAGLDNAIGPVLTHGAVENVNQCYRIYGVHLPATRPVADVNHKNEFCGAMVIAPPSADMPAWTKKFPQTSKAFASGWMQIRGNRRRRALDRGFVLSDHCDWNGLVDSILASGAETVWVTHGYAPELVRWLSEKGLDARALATQFSGEVEDPRS